ncbi:MAG: class I SAM-dependent methyltransferase [Desulfobulbaceae bacterium]|nr:MAG: class I SAM-dependent methyltransferase [Desulfobulbaceae bacterium]
MTEPTGYEDEPREVFTPVTAQSYAALYHLELSDFKADFRFYQALLQQFEARFILECGCGTGRIQRFLHEYNFSSVGIDISSPMLQKAATQGGTHLVAMDMCSLGFCNQFDAVIIPYNTLNLLTDEKTIARCLSEIYTVLKSDGVLLLQLYTPDRQLRENPFQRFFQFSMKDIDDGGKLITESIKQFDPEKKISLLEQRYKIRYPGKPEQNVNQVINHELAAFSPSEWFEIINTSGYHVSSCYRDYELNTHGFETDGPLLFAATPSS